MRRRARGSVLFELVWVLPVFFMLTGLIIWCSLELHARTAVRSALFSGLRLAAARGNKGEIGDNMIEPIESYVATGIENDRARALLMTADIAKEVGSGRMGYFYYQHSLQPVFHGPLYEVQSLSALRREYTFSLAYIYAEIRTHLGGLVRFPCDPTKPGGANCLRCQFLNPRPDRFDLSQYTDGVSGLELPFLAERCTYLPADPLSKALAPLLGLGQSFWPLVEWEGVTNIYRHGYIDEVGDFNFQELG